MISGRIDLDYRVCRSIKQFINRMRVGKKCRFGHNVIIDSHCVFEGNNKLTDDVTFLNSQIGYSSYVGDNSFIKNTCIGRYSCIASDVITIAGNHPVNYVSIHPAFYSSEKDGELSYVEEDKFPDFKYIDPTHKISILIGSDVWIGSRVTILENVRIGDGAVIGAGAVVTKDVPPYAIVGGVPARIIRYRFSDEIRRQLLEFKWWNREEQWLRDHGESFSDVNDFIEQLQIGRAHV